MSAFLEFSFKKFGYLEFNQNLSEQLLQHNIKGFIKIVFVEAGGHAIIDYKEYF